MICSASASNKAQGTMRPALGASHQRTRQLGTSFHAPPCAQRPPLPRLFGQTTVSLPTCFQQGSCGAVETASPPPPADRSLVNGQKDLVCLDFADLQAGRDLAVELEKVRKVGMANLVCRQAWAFKSIAAAASFSQGCQVPAAYRDCFALSHACFFLPPTPPPLARRTGPTGWASWW